MPICLIIDQDPAMKVATGDIFKSTTHRNCIWDIMKMLYEMVGCYLNNDTGYTT